MSRVPKTIIEYRNYVLPEYFPILLLSGEQWRISDIPSERLHFHNCLEIGICESDSGTMQLADKTYPFQAGDITFIAKNISHTTYSSPGVSSKWSYLFIDVETLLRPLFPLQILDQRDNLIHLLHHCNFILPGQEYPVLFFLIKEIIYEIQKKDPDYSFSVRGLFISLILNLLPIYKKFEAHTPSSPPEKTLIIAPAINYIHAHYMDEFTIEYLAGICCLSLTHFRRLFTSIIGEGPLKYMNHLRIQKASELLRTTEMPILNISEEVGFHSLSSFNRHFFSDTSETPTQWRRKSIAALHPSIRKFAGWMVPPTM